MLLPIEDSWKNALAGEFEKAYFKELITITDRAYRGAEPIYPPAEDIFSAFKHCPFSEVNVVILGQDPYHRHGQANGLCFSVGKNVSIPPSLRNIFKELHTDLGIDVPISGNLTSWATQGVLLLNTTLTVIEGKPGSHHGIGWELFTHATIETLSREKEHLVFMLWGRYAQMKGEVIDATKHLILKAPHPSPLSAYTGFFGCKHFSKANEYMHTHRLETVDWSMLQ